MGSLDRRLIAIQISFDLAGHSRIAVVGHTVEKIGSNTMLAAERQLLQHVVGDFGFLGDVPLGGIPDPHVSRICILMYEVCVRSIPWTAGFEGWEKCLPFTYLRYIRYARFVSLPVSLL